MDDREIEARLAAARPEPPDEFVERLERRLLGPAPQPSRFARWRGRLAIAGATVAATAGILLALALTGSDPLSDDSSVSADPSCTTTLVATVARVPTVVVGADDEPKVVKRRQETTKAVTTCPPAASRPSTAP